MAPTQNSSANVAGNKSTASGQTLPPAQEMEAGTRDVKEAVGNLNEFIQQLNRTLQFRIDEDSGRTVIKVVDSETEEVIRQIPPEEVLAIARHMSDGDGLII